VDASQTLTPPQALCLPLCAPSCMVPQALPYPVDTLPCQNLILVTCKERGACGLIDTGHIIDDSPNPLFLRCCPALCCRPLCTALLDALYSPYHAHPCAVLCSVPPLQSFDVNCGISPLYRNLEFQSSNCLVLCCAVSMLMPGVLAVVAPSVVIWTG
jgi:hypothetical protein